MSTQKIALKKLDDHRYEVIAEGRRGLAALDVNMQEWEISPNLTRYKDAIVKRIGEVRANEQKSGKSRGAS